MKNFKSFQGSDALPRVPGRPAGRPYKGEEKHGTRGSVSVRALSIALALFAGLFYASAQPYTIDWFTIDGGGGMNGTGGTFTLSGTIGQPDAGILGGGMLDGGFWGLVGPLQPLLTITRSSNNIIISWPSPSTGFVLQENTDLSGGVWNNVAQVPSDNGVIKSVTGPPSSVAKYYRLKNPGS